jgi:hypothetical protein
VLGVGPPMTAPEIAMLAARSHTMERAADLGQRDVAPDGRQVILTGSRLLSFAGAPRRDRPRHGCLAGCFLAKRPHARGAPRSTA